MKTFLSRLIFPLVLLCGLHAGTADDHGAQFPGNAALRSPNGQYEVYCVDAETPADAKRLGDNHELFLKEVGTGATRKVITFGRHVAVAWAPSNDVFFINDHYGSGQVKCRIFACSSGQARELSHRFSSADCEAVAWVNGSSFKLIVHDAAGEREEIVTLTGAK